MQTAVPELSPAPPEAPSVASRFNPASVLRSRRYVDLLVVVGVTAFVFVQLRPDLLFGPNLDDGGDTAAHVVAVSYFIHHLLSHGALSGWDPQWFDGFPLYVFYFPLPALLVGIANLFVPYAVAFKLVTVLGAVTLPAAAYAFGRLANLRAPMPSLLAVAMLPFLFNPSYTIDGGNLPSTLAGEFSFSLAVTLGVLFLGVFIRTLRTGNLRVLGAALFALTVLCHVVPALFFGGAAIVVALCEADRRRTLRLSVQVLAAGSLLAGFWLIRFAADLGYSSSMNYGRVGDVGLNLFPHTVELSVQILAIVGLVIAIAKRIRVMLAVALCALASVGAFTLLPSGLVYNARWLPFWFLMTAVLAAYAIAECARFAFSERHQELNMLITPAVSAAVVVSAVAVYLGAFPFYATPTAWQSFIPGWVSWNYSGYQARSGWTEFSDLVSMLQGASEVDGCGRLDYEYTANAESVFGSTLAEMSFPYFTNGCIDVTEGVYYESSTTNPFHFLDQSELSVSASNPVVGLPYQGLNVRDGIRHLQLEGVKYFLANSIEVENQAATDPLLEEVTSIPATANVVEGSTSPATSLRWVLYEVKGVSLVSPLTKLPVVEAGQSKATWQQTGITWYQSPAYWPVEIVRSGARGWPREGAGVLVNPALEADLPSNEVTNVRSTDAQISFDVEHPGLPVLVREPFFPNWHAIGADGPFEASPNLMVVVPHGTHVVLSYGTTSSDWLARGGSLAGAALAMRLAVTRDAPRGANDPAPSSDGGTVYGPFLSDIARTDDDATGNESSEDTGADHDPSRSQDDASDGRRDVGTPRRPRSDVDVIGRLSRGEEREDETPWS